jgi:hypothetical protein
MSRFGRTDTYQFAIATGLDYTKETQAPLLKAPPGESWELVFIQYVTDWYTVWRRPRGGHAARQEIQELADKGYEPPPVPCPNPTPTPVAETEGST